MKSKYYLPLIATILLSSCTNTVTVDAKAGRNVLIKSPYSNLEIKKAKAGQDISVCYGKKFSSPPLYAPRDVNLVEGCPK